MSIINDALKKAEQFRQWGSQEVSSQKFSTTSGTQSAVLEEPLPPKIQPNVSRVRITVQAPVEISRELPARNNTVISKAASSNSFLIVSLIGLSILIVVGLFLLLSNFATTSSTILEQGMSKPVLKQEIVPVAAKSESSDSIEDSSTVLKQEPAVAKPIARPERKAPRPPKSQYQLTGIYGIGAHERYAFINGKIVQTGGSINDATVLSIDQNTVTLKRGNRVFSLTMP